MSEREEAERGRSGVELQRSGERTLVIPRTHPMYVSQSGGHDYLTGSEEDWAAIEAAARDIREELEGSE